MHCYAIALPLRGKWCSQPRQAKQTWSHGEFFLGLNKKKREGEEKERLLLRQGWTSTLCNWKGAGCQARSWNATTGSRAREPGLNLAPTSIYLPTSILGKFPLGKYREGQQRGRFRQVQEVAWAGVFAPTRHKLNLLHCFLAEIAGNYSVLSPCCDPAQQAVPCQDSPL